MTNDPLISVLIPIYNVEQYVAEAIGSIQNQTYTNLEIIVVDDASTDNSYKIVEKLAITDDRIILLRNEKNSKIVYSLNKAFSVSKGGFIGRMDGDDVSEPDRFEKKLDFLRNSPEYGLVGCSTLAINEEGNEIGKSAYPSNFKKLKRLIPFKTPVSHIWLARREVYEKLNGYRNIVGVEDYDFLLRVITETEYKFSNLEDYFGYKIRIRGGNTQSQMGLEQRMLHHIVFKLYKERISFGEEKKELDDSLNAVKLIRHREKEAYKKSQFYQNKYFAQKKKNKFLSFIFFLYAIVLSKHQYNYYFRKLKYLIGLKF